jgi:alpha-amylase
MYYFGAPNNVMRKIVLLLTAASLFTACGTENQNTSPENTETDRKEMNWIKHTNIYEVNLRQYTPEGTINAFRKHLPRLKDMGVQTLWFMPITPIAQKNKKGELGSYYAAGDYTSVSSEFGTTEDFKALVRQAHELGMKVIIDWVANHTGWDHVWTKQHPDWYLKDSATKDFKIASGMDDIIELDYSNRDMRKGMIDAMKFWVDQAGIDGFRCDLAFWVEVDFWKEAKDELEKTKKLFWLGELDPLENPAFLDVFHAAYTWKWMHKTKEWYEKNQSVDSLRPLLKDYEAAPGIKTWFTTNHDENSWNGTEYEKYGDAALPLAVFSITWKGIPLIYSGQELPNKKRLEFFKKDTIDWTDNIELHEFYKTLLEFRAGHPALSADAEVIPVETTSDGSILAFLRRSGEREVLVLLNLSDRIQKFDIRGKEVDGKYTDIFSGEEKDLSGEKFAGLRAWGYQVLSK